MNRLLLSALFFSVPSFAIAQPALLEAPEFPAVRPGPNGIHDGASCFLLASGTITPGDVDWVQVMIPWMSSRTVVDVDFVAGTGSSVVLGSRVAGNTVLGMADSNAARDALCGLSGSTVPVGSPTDSAIEMGPTPHHAVIDIGVSGSPDTSFTGNHSQSFVYLVWVYVNPILCHTDAECTDNVACTQESCDVATGVCNSTPNHSECQDSSWCNGQEVCSMSLGCRPGIPVNCNDGVSCTQDTCNENLDMCVHIPRDNLCNNGTFCDGDEWCDAQLGCQVGEPVDCDDGDDCTVDSCDPDVDDCVSVSSDSACDDGLFCNGVETCSSETGCAEGEDPCPNQMCDEAHDRCANCLTDTDCDDGEFCNGAEVCDAGSGLCQDGEAPNCDDDVDCTADACDEAQNRCMNTPQNVMCDDGLFCNGVETCDAAEGCVGGDAPDCDDNVDCTADACDEAHDRCSHTPRNLMCDDGLFCNGAETCDATEGCVDGDAPCGNQLCDESANNCVDCVSDADCDDGVFCNGQEKCNTAGACVDGDEVCSGRLCDEDNRQCAQCLSDADCNDGVFCNGEETCGAGVCQNGKLPECTDEDNCTTDYCDLETDQCAHDESKGACDDGLFCNGTESCGYFGCQLGTPPCHDSLCDEANDRCVGCLTNGDCDNGVYCDGVEYCDVTSGRCGIGSIPTCDDGNDCTSDHCDTLADACAHVPNNAACDDGLFCNGLERCDANDGCVNGDVPCGDGFCDEAANRCVNCQSDADCDDGVFCNGNEVCNTVTGSCQGGTPPCDSNEQCDEESESCNSAKAAIDIVPAMCPNYHKPLKNDFLKVAIVGSQQFNVSQVDLGSLVLRRADGTGLGVEPMRHKHHRHGVQHDVSRDGKTDGCSCNGLGGDGIPDLVLKFDNDDLVRHLRLDRLRDGSTVDFVLTGQMLDGTPFEATDCVTLGAPPKKGKH